MTKKLFLIAFIFVLALVAVIFSLVKQKQQPEVPVVVQSKKQVSFKDLAPGKSTETEVAKSLGQPVRKEQNQKGTTLVFASGLGKQPINVTVDPSKTVRLIIEPVSPNVRFGSLVSGLPAPDATLYGDFARLGFSLSVYLSSGTAILANPQTEEVKERWYFAPTTLGEFKTNFAPAYRDQPVEVGE